MVELDKFTGRQRASFPQGFGPQAAVLRKQVDFPPLHLAVELNELAHQRCHNGQKTDVFLKIHLGAE